MLTLFACIAVLEEMAWILLMTLNTIDLMAGRSWRRTSACWARGSAWAGSSISLLAIIAFITFTAACLITYLSLGGHDNHADGRTSRGIKLNVYGN